MNGALGFSKSLNKKRMLTSLLICVLMISAGVGVGYLIGAKPSESQPTEPTGYAANPAYEYMVGSAAWQMSAEAHALMMQGFHLAEKNIDEMVGFADDELNGYRWIESNGEKKLYLNEKRVCVVCDIDDTLVDGVHYRYVAGIKSVSAGNLVVELLLINLDTNQEVVKYTTSISGSWITETYATGSIVMYGGFYRVVNLDKIYSVYTGVSNVYAIDKVSEILG